MDTLSRTEVFEENDQPGVKTRSSGAGVGVFFQASNIRIVGEVLVMVAIATCAWFVWRQVMPHLWPAGPALLVAPGFWVFMGAGTVARAIWNILFLCPKVR